MQAFSFNNEFVYNVTPMAEARPLALALEARPGPGEARAEARLEQVTFDFCVVICSAAAQ